MAGIAVSAVVLAALFKVEHFNWITAALAGLPGVITVGYALMKQTCPPGYDSDLLDLFLHGRGFGPRRSAETFPDALLLDNTLDENVALRNAGARRGVMHWNALRSATAEIISAFDVRASGVSSDARALSGGNQQKLVLGRELANHPAALVVENPTRGLDFRATASVHAALRSARDAGTAIVMYASDIDEVLALSDRVYVMHNGVVFETVRDREVVGRAMLTGAPS